MEGLAHLIDHAPLFPPASMDMPAAVAEDARARKSEHAWMLARFVCPASRLPELEAQLGDDQPPAVSAVLDGGDWATSALPVEAIEMVGPPDFELTGVELFCEVPLDGDWRDTLAAVAAAGGKAKLRCGGQHVPSVEEVAAFFAAAREHGFLNFLTAADRAAAGADEAELREILAVTDASELGTGSARGRALFVSIGSCSFAEPVEELQGLGLL
jgi:hypothetical protein